LQVNDLQVRDLQDTSATISNRCEALYYDYALQPADTAQHLGRGGGQSCEALYYDYALQPADTAQHLGRGGGQSCEALYYDYA
jgi:hypothetical protein